MSRSTNTPATQANGSNDMASRYAMTKTQINALVAEINTPTGFINNVTKLFTQPIDNMIALYCFPFDVKNLDPVWRAQTDGPLIINIVTMSTTGAFLNPLTTPLLNIGETVLGRYFGNFLDYAPYTKIELYLPYIGFVTLDNDLVLGKRLIIRYAVDLCTGSCTAFVITRNMNDTTGSTETVILTQNGTIGIQIPMSGGSGSDIARSMLKFGISTGAGAASFGVSVNKGMEAALASEGGSVGGVVARAGAAGLLASTAIGAVTAGQIPVHKNGKMDANTGFYGPQNAYLIWTRPSINYPSSYNAQYGRPSGKTKTLSTLTGFTVVDSVHVEGAGFNSATSDELSEIERLLKSGVIL